MMTRSASDLIGTLGNVLEAKTFLLTTTPITRGLFAKSNDSIFAVLP